MNSRKKNREKTSPIFIGGLEKSGTSLIRKLVGRHPNIFASYETHWFTKEMRIDWKNSWSKRQRLFRELYEISEKEFLFIKTKARSGEHFFTLLMEHCTQREGKKRWAEKTPDNLKNFNLIKKNWPSSQFIHNVRDFRDVYASWKIHKSRPLSSFIDKYREIYSPDNMDAFCNVDHVMTLKYEDLVLNTHRFLSDVFDFLNEPWFSFLSEYNGDSSELNKLSTVLSGHPGATAISMSKPIFDSSIQRWERDLSLKEIKAIETVCKDGLEKFGYIV